MKDRKFISLDTYIPNEYIFDTKSNISNDNYTILKVAQKVIFNRQYIYSTDEAKELNRYEFDSGISQYKNKLAYKSYRDGFYTSANLKVETHSKEGFIEIFPSTIYIQSDTGKQYDILDDDTYIQATQDELIAYLNLEDDNSSPVNKKYWLLYETDSKNVKITNLDKKFPAYIRIMKTLNIYKKFKTELVENTSLYSTHIMSPTYTNSQLPFNIGLNFPLDIIYDKFYSEIYNINGENTGNIGGTPVHASALPSAPASNTYTYVDYNLTSDLASIPNYLIKNGSEILFSNWWKFALTNIEEYFSMINVYDNTEHEIFELQGDPNSVVTNSSQGVGDNQLGFYTNSNRLWEFLYLKNGRRVMKQISRLFIPKFIETLLNSSTVSTSVKSQIYKDVSNTNIKRFYLGFNFHPGKQTDGFGYTDSGYYKFTSHLLYASDLINSSGSSDDTTELATTYYRYITLIDSHQYLNLLNVSLPPGVDTKIETDIFESSLYKIKKEFDGSTKIPSFNMIEINVSTFNRKVYIGNPNGTYYVIPAMSTKSIIIPSTGILSENDTYSNMFTDKTLHKVKVWTDETTNIDEYILSINSITTYPNIKDIFLSYGMAKNMETIDFMYYTKMFIYLISPIVYHYIYLLGSSLSLPSTMIRLFWELHDTDFANLYSIIHSDTVVDVR